MIVDELNQILTDIEDTQFALKQLQTVAKDIKKMILETGVTGDTKYEKFSDWFKSLTMLQQNAFAYSAAKMYVRQISSNYDLETVNITKMSLHPEDWYLYAVSVRNSKNKTYSVWTMNLSIGELNSGYYDVSAEQVINILKNKKL